MEKHEQLSWLADIVVKMLSAQRGLKRLGVDDLSFNEVIRTYGQELQYLRDLRSKGEL